MHLKYLIMLIMKMVLDTEITSWLCDVLQIFPEKKYIKLCIGPNSCPRLLVCLDEHQSKTSGNCLSLEVKEAKEWQGTAAWEYFSFKVILKWPLKRPINIRS